MTWADRIVGEIEARFAKKIASGSPLVIRDEKTLSGRVHVGSLRGVVIHGLLAEVLGEKKIKNVFHFELNDFDPMDEIPATLSAEQRQEYLKYMGQPLYTVPSTEAGSQAYPMVFGNELKDVLEPLHLPMDFYNLEPLYKGGKFNEVIREALDHSKEIRDIYREVSGSQKPDDWYPLQVICENCGKVGTTQVTGWDGNLVTYECKEHMVKWAKGCKHKGSISPFDGNAKLPWKVEWPAKWKVMGVDIEGAGKDHSAAGGSREIGKRICEEVFHYPNPFDIPYEFFNIGGKKMSASKGLGASAKAISDLLPPKLLKLLMIRKFPNQPIDFDPEGVTIPQLFDEYDRLSDHFFKRRETAESDFARIFHLAQIDFPKLPEDSWQMRFSLVAFLVQMPHLDIKKEAEQLKGSPLSSQELDDLDERCRYVRQWLQQYAPEKFIFTIIPTDSKISLPELGEEQKNALRKFSEKLETVEWTGPGIHQLLHAIKEEEKIPPVKLFAPLYRVFLNRDDGPQMGWFLSTFTRSEVQSRIGSIL